MPSGLKRVRRKLATGAVKVYWYHRATGKRLLADPATAEGFLEVAALDARSMAVAALSDHPTGTLAALWVVYRDSPEWRTLKPRTRSDYQAVRDWLGDGAKAARVRTITTAKVLALRDKAGKEKGRRFANYVVSVLRLVLEWGKPRGWIGDNPARGIKPIRKPVGSRKVNRAWSMDEVVAFAAAAEPYLLVTWALGLFAGMRQGDAIIVTWAAYDGSLIRWVAGKNGEECTAPVTGVFKLILDSAKQHRGDALQIAVTSHGTPWTASGFRASFFKVLRKLRDAGLVKQGCTFHGLRHTVAAIARDGGKSDSHVAAGIGDRSTAMAAIYGQEADRMGAQQVVLEGIQKHFGNIEWKTDWKTPDDDLPVVAAK